MIQIKEFLDHREDGIENDVNTWIEENNVDVVDIKFSTSIWPVDVEYGWHPEHSYHQIKYLFSYHQQTGSIQSHQD